MSVKEQTTTIGVGALDSELDHHLDEARRRLRHNPQLTFDIFAPGDSVPDFASLKIKGDLPLAGDLRRGSGMVVTVTNLEGEVIARREGVVGWPGFKDTTDKFGDVTTERIETVQL